MRVFLGVSAPFRPLDAALYGEGAQEPQRPVHQRWNWHPDEAQGQVLKLAQPDTVKKWQPNWFYPADIRTYAGHQGLLPYITGAPNRLMFWGAKLTATRLHDIRLLHNEVLWLIGRGSPC